MLNRVSRAALVVLCLGLLPGAALLLGEKAAATPLDVWSLSGDFANATNPGSAIDPGAPGGGTGAWSYVSDTLGTAFPQAIASNPSTEANAELPTSGIGWTLTGGSHISISLFSSGDGTKTNFVAGDVGGHTPYGARWTTDHAGTFLLEWLGYNGRDQSSAVGSEAGRVTTLTVQIVGGGGPLGLGAKNLTGGVEDGSANAYTDSALVTLNAGDIVQIFMTGNDWSGMDLEVTEMPEASLPILAGTAGLALLGARRRRA